MRNSYLRTFRDKVHALKKSERLSDGETRKLEKHMKLLCRYLDVKDVKKAKRQTAILAEILLTILGR